MSIQCGIMTPNLPFKKKDFRLINYNFFFLFLCFMVILTILFPSAGFCECVGHSSCDVHLGPVFYAGLGTVSPQTFQPGTTGAPQGKVHEGPGLLANERGSCIHVDKIYSN